jgi:hypothetical protein
LYSVCESIVDGPVPPDDPVSIRRTLILRAFLAFFAIDALPDTREELPTFPQTTAALDKLCDLVSTTLGLARAKAEAIINTRAGERSDSITENEHFAQQVQHTMVLLAVRAACPKEGCADAPANYRYRNGYYLFDHDRTSHSTSKTSQSVKFVPLPKNRYKQKPLSDQ